MRKIKKKGKIPDEEFSKDKNSAYNNYLDKIYHHHELFIL